MKSRFLNASGRMKQRGVALFFALIALVAIMLAAVTLIRSVDTSTMISGNLAFQQAATASGDSGTEKAINWLAFTEANDGGKNVLNDASHLFNIDAPTKGYYASLDPTKSLTSTSGTGFKWITAPGATQDSVGLAADSSSNTVSYIIQRMCSASGVAVQDTNCLFSGAALDNNKQNIPLPQEICKGPGCPVAGQTPMNRITSKVTGPKNTLSYVQAFVY
jgi:type IV pilus assembly protein PilX